MSDVSLFDPETLVIETERIRIRAFTEHDAEFILKHFNEPEFIAGIADRGIRPLEDARQYLIQGPMAMYQTLGYGLGAIELRDSHQMIGTCGLLKRDYLPEPDVGYSLLSAFWGKGYVTEAVRALMTHSAEVRGLNTLEAIVNADNPKSRAVLDRLGFCFKETIQIPPDNTAVMRMQWQSV